jgi:pimeloyl-ACP methyl ester carboxylesterase
MPRPPSPRRAMLRAVVLLALLALVWPATSAVAQEACGDGTTFTVDLPSLAGGRGDSVTLPNGCRIYALLVSGYERNNKLDELTFYKLARFVLANNGYVHWAWWNNLLKEYMGGPLHPDETFTVPVVGTVFPPTPGGLIGVHAAGFVPASHELGIIPKAVPEDDFQFQADAARMLLAIRAKNPTAIIVVAGHSMGGGAVARLGTNRAVSIDLLAPIDPVGNRSSPVGRPTVGYPVPDHTFNWTRWRASRDFRGFKFADCVRNAIGLCQNFGTFLQPQHHCTTRGPLRDAPPPFPGSLDPLHCPGPWEDPGTQLQFGRNIGRLYYRYQKETIFPFDYPADEYFGHWAPRNPPGSLTDSFNTQRAVLPNARGENDPNKTCSSPLDADPRSPLRRCNPSDGHGEIIGFRFPTPGLPNPPGPNIPVAPLALQALDWPQYDDAQTPAQKEDGARLRRQFLLDLRAQGNLWPHQPLEPDLDMVSDDMVTIVSFLLSQQPAAPGPPVTVATPSPEANENGWNNDDVEVTLTATPGPGRSVASIQFSLAGAQTAPVTSQAGDAAHVTVTEEGETTITYFARDDAGGEEAPHELTIRLDRTPPYVTAALSPEPNAQGWNHSDVTVTFSATDALSGRDAVDPPVVVSTEGARQEVIGRATDLAGNAAAVVVTVNLDKTPPQFSGFVRDGCAIWPPDRRFVEIASVSGIDGLSGVEPGSLAVTATNSEAGAGGGDIQIAGGDVRVRADRAGAGSGRTYTVRATISDLAGNVADQRGDCTVPHDMGRKHR